MKLSINNYSKVVGERASRWIELAKYYDYLIFVTNGNEDEPSRVY